MLKKIFLKFIAMNKKINLFTSLWLIKRREGYIFCEYKYTNNYQITLCINIYATDKMKRMNIKNNYSFMFDFEDYM